MRAVLFVAALLAVSLPLPGAGAVSYCEDLPVEAPRADCVGVDEWLCTGAALREERGNGWIRVTCAGSFGRGTTVFCLGTATALVYTPGWGVADYECVGRGFLWDGAVYHTCMGSGYSTWDGSTWSWGCQGVLDGPIQ